MPLTEQAEGGFHFASTLAWVCAIVHLGVHFMLKTDHDGDAVAIKFETKASL